MMRLEIPEETKKEEVISLNTRDIAASMAESKYSNPEEAKIASQVAPRFALRIPAAIPVSVSRPLAYNRALQQVRIHNLLPLSTGNGLQFFLLLALNPRGRYVNAQFEQSEIFRRLNADLDLNVFINNLRELLAEQFQNNEAVRQNPRAVLSQNMRRYYQIAQAVAAGNPPPPLDENNQNNVVANPAPRAQAAAGGADDLPLRIAQAIAVIYYQNLEVKVEEAAGVMRRLIPNSKDRKRLLSDADFLQRISNASLDNNRYPLQSLLPDEQFIPQAARKALKFNLLDATKSSVNQLGASVSKGVKPVKKAFDKLGVAFAPVKRNLVLAGWVIREGAKIAYHALPSKMRDDIEKGIAQTVKGGKKVASGVHDAHDKTKDFFRTLLNGAREAFTHLVRKIQNAIPETIKPLFRDIQDSFKRGWNRMKTVMIPGGGKGGPVDYHDDPEEPGADDDLQDYKNRVTAVLSKYINLLKGSWFGHHHDNRARAVRRQIRNSPNVPEIRHILQRQEQIMGASDDLGMGPLVETEWDNLRWNEQDTLKNTPPGNHVSGYCSVIEQALQVQPRNRM